MRNRPAKTIMVMLLIFACVIGGCGVKSNKKLYKSGTQEESSSKVFAITCMDESNPYFGAIINEMKSRIEENGDELIVYETGNDISKQASVIKQMIDDDVDGIFLNPVDSNKIVDSLGEVSEEGIPIVGFDAEIEDMSYLNAYVGSDNYNAGFVVGKDLLEKCREGGDIVILDSINALSSTDRVNGFLAAIQPGKFKIYAQHDCDGEKEKAKEQMEIILSQNSDIVAVFGENDPTALGALAAVEEAGLTDIMVYGVDGSLDMREKIADKSSLVEGTGAQSPKRIAQKSVEVMYKILDGEEVEEYNSIETFLISKDNIDYYGVTDWL